MDSIGPLSASLGQSLGASLGGGELDEIPPDPCADLNSTIDIDDLLPRMCQRWGPVNQRACSPLR